MEVIRAEGSPGQSVGRADGSWRALYRAGGVSGLLVGTIYLVAAVLIFVIPSPPTSGATATLEYIAAHRSLYILKQVLWLGSSVLAMIVFLALYPALKGANKSYAAIGTVLSISAWALSLAWPTTGEGSLILVTLSDGYTTASSGAARTAFATAAEALIATEATPTAIGILTLGILVVSLVMLRSPFPRWVAYLGVATGTVGILSEALSEVLGAAYALYGVLVMVWFLVAGWKLLLLARPR